MRGFTLLELLVAIAVFALLSAMGFVGLQSLLQTSAVAEQHAASLARLERALALLQQDLEQVVPRPVRDNQGDTVPALAALANDAVALELSRTGWLNPQRAPVPGLQRVSYRRDGERLVRSAWPVLDRAPDTAPVETLVLDQVHDLRLRFLDAQGDWQSSWPPAANPNDIPRAVEIHLDVAPWGELLRLFRLPGATAS